MGLICCALFAASPWATATGLLPPCRNTDYAATMAAADREASLMVVYFCDENDFRCQRFERALAASPVLCSRLSACRCVATTTR